MDIDDICLDLFGDNHEIQFHVQSDQSEDSESEENELELDPYVPLTQKSQMQKEHNKREIRIKANKTLREWNELMENQLEELFELFQEEWGEQGHEDPFDPDTLISCDFYFTDEPVMAFEYYTDDVEYPFPFPVYLNLEAIEDETLKRKWKKLYVFGGLHCIPSFRYHYLDAIWGIFLRFQVNDGELEEDDIDQIVEIARDPNQNLIEVGPLNEDEEDPQDPQEGPEAD